MSRRSSPGSTRPRASSPRRGQQFGDNVASFYAKARDESLYLSYTIIHPTVDRSKPPHEQYEPNLYVSVVRERDDGIVLRGAQMLGTGSVMSDYIFVSCILPLSAGSEDYAISLVVPNSADGLRIYSRRSYASGNPGGQRLPAVDSLRRDRLVGGLRRRVRAVGARLRLPQHRADGGAVPPHGGALARQHAGADSLCGQAALLRRAGPTASPTAAGSPTTRRRSSAWARSRRSARSPRRSCWRPRTARSSTSSACSGPIRRCCTRR